MIPAITVTLLLWASAFVAIRYVDRSLSAGGLACGRLLIGSVALGAVMLARGERLPRGRAFWLSLGCGVLWFGLYNLALNAGERRIDAGTSALLVNTGPIFLALLAGTVLREGFPRVLLGGCAVAFAGTTLIAVGVSTHGASDLWGVLLCLVAAACYAIGVIAQKPALADASSLSVTWTACTVGAVSLLGYAPSLFDSLRHVSGAVIGWTVYLGVGPTAVGFLCWGFVLARWPAGRTGATTYLVPPLVVLIGWLALSETPPWLALPGGLLCLSGVALTRRRG